jgi:hypothetical protein
MEVDAVRRSVEMYFHQLSLKRLSCEPHLVNPRRTARFDLRASNTGNPHHCAGSLNFRQPVTQWVISRPAKLAS